MIAGDVPPPPGELILRSPGPKPRLDHPPIEIAIIKGPEYSSSPRVFARWAEGWVASPEAYRPAMAVLLEMLARKDALIRYLAKCGIVPTDEVATDATWTTEVPTIPGQYRHREGPDKPARLCLIDDDRDIYFIGGTEYGERLTDFIRQHPNGQWCPVDPPGAKEVAVAAERARCAAVVRATPVVEYAIACEQNAWATLENAAKRIESGVTL